MTKGDRNNDTTNTFSWKDLFVVMELRYWAGNDPKVTLLNGLLCNKWSILVVVSVSVEYTSFRVVIEGIGINDSNE